MQRACLHLEVAWAGDGCKRFAFILMPSQHFCGFNEGIRVVTMTFRDNESLQDSGICFVCWGWLSLRFHFFFFKSQINQGFKHLGKGAGYYTKPAVYSSIYWLHNSSLQPMNLKSVKFIADPQLVTFIFFRGLDLPILGRPQSPPSISSFSSLLPFLFLELKKKKTNPETLQWF